MTCKNYWDQFEQKEEVALSGSFEIRGTVPQAFKKMVAAKRAERERRATAKEEINKAECISSAKKPPVVLQTETSHKIENDPPSRGVSIHTSCGHRIELVDHTPQKKPTGVPMGGSENPMFQPGTVLPRAFRFLIESPTSTSLTYFIKSVKVDYVEKKMILDIYDTVDGTAFNWMTNHGNVLTQTMLDGCGTKLYNVTYEHLKLVGHKMGLDYASSEVPMHHCTLTFEKMTRKSLLPPTDLSK